MSKTKSNTKKRKQDKSLEEDFYDFAMNRASWVVDDKTEEEARILAEAQESIKDEECFIEEGELMYYIKEIATINAIKGYRLGFLESAELADIFLCHRAKIRLDRSRGKGIIAMDSNDYAIKSLR